MTRWRFFKNVPQQYYFPGHHSLRKQNFQHVQWGHGLSLSFVRSMEIRTLLMTRWRFLKTYRKSTFLAIILWENKFSSTFNEATDCLCPLLVRRWMKIQTLLRNLAASSWTLNAELWVTWIQVETTCKYVYRSNVAQIASQRGVKRFQVDSNVILGKRWNCTT